VAGGNCPPSRKKISLSENYSRNTKLWAGNFPFLGKLRAQLKFSAPSISSRSLKVVTFCPHLFQPTTTLRTYLLINTRRWKNTGCSVFNVVCTLVTVDVRPYLQAAMQVSPVGAVRTRFPDSKEAQETQNWCKISPGRSSRPHSQLERSKFRGGGRSHNMSTLGRRMFLVLCQTRILG